MKRTKISIIITGVMIVMGLGLSSKSDLPAGQVFYTVTPSFVSDNIIKVISVLFGLAILVFFLINDFYAIKNWVIGKYSVIRARVLSR